MSRSGAKGSTNSRNNKLGKKKKNIIKAPVMERDVTSTCIWFSMFPESLVGPTSRVDPWSGKYYDLSKRRDQIPSDVPSHPKRSVT